MKNVLLDQKRHMSIAILVGFPFVPRNASRIRQALSVPEGAIQGAVGCRISKASYGTPHY